MRLIGFQSRYIAPIVSGAKTVTLRKSAAPTPHVGEVVGFRCRYDRPPFAWARITSVSAVDRDLFQDWAADGFATRAEWEEALTELYGTAPLIAIGWELVPEPETPSPLF